MIRIYIIRRPWLDTLEHASELGVDGRLVLDKSPEFVSRRKKNWLNDWPLVDCDRGLDSTMMIPQLLGLVVDFLFQVVQSLLMNFGAGW
jgi:hypothetical protein